MRTDSNSSPLSIRFRTNPVIAETQPGGGEMSELVDDCWVPGGGTYATVQGQNGKTMSTIEGIEHESA